MNLDDVLFMAFRHKWLLVSFGILALIGAVAVRVVKPPLYVSKAKLLLHYVTETKGVATDGPDTTIKTLDAGTQATIAAEIEILMSLDVAKQVAKEVGPARILARKEGGDDLMAAAGVVCSGIEVDPPRSTIITVAFKHPDPEVVQPVLEALITAYMKQHTMIHSLSGVLGVAYSEQRDKLRSKLTQTEVELKRLKTQANVLFVEDSKKAYQEEIAKVQKELRETETELAVRRSVLGDVPQVVSSDGTAAPTPVPAEKVREYSDVCGEMESLKRRYRELLREYTEAFPAVRTVREQIEKLVDEKAALTNAWPALALVSVPGLSGGTNSAGGDLAEEIAEVRKLTAKVAVLGMRLTNVQAEASRVMDLEPKITELTRQHDEEEATYRRVLKGLEQEQMNEAMAAGKITNMSVVQTPTLPGIDYKKFLKRVAIVMAACFGLGVALVLLFELVLDRTIKRTHDVERHLGLPIFLTIPDVNWSGGLRHWWRARLQFAKRTPSPSADPNGSVNPQRALEPWKPENPLQAYADGLRERLVTYFEINNLNQKKPKLVAVTGCGKESGVSTLAGGLAASLSKIGDGNVLLVDMNNGQGVAHSFYQGNPGCGLTDVLEPEGRAEAQVQENLYLAALNGGEGDDKLAKVVPSRFTHLVPKLKASDYDYIIFDMPPVSPTSSTPRLSSYMDIVLLVLESEKTGQQTAARAGALMREARANVAAVLNKYRPHVPQKIAQEL